MKKFWIFGVLGFNFAGSLKLRPAASPFAAPSTAPGSSPFQAPASRVGWGIEGKGENLHRHLQKPVLFILPRDTGSRAAR